MHSLFEHDTLNFQDVFGAMPVEWESIDKPAGCIGEIGAVARDEIDKTRLNLILFCFMLTGF